jgi:hypothetical protein
MTASDYSALFSFAIIALAIPLAWATCFIMPRDYTRCLLVCAISVTAQLVVAVLMTIADFCVSAMQGAEDLPVVGLVSLIAGWFWREWLKRRRRKRAPRSLGYKARAMMAALLARYRPRSSQLAPVPA